MFYSPHELNQRAQAYCLKHKLQLVTDLGHGMQGMVFSTSRKSAIKVHADKAAYTRELHAYERLALHNVATVGGLIIPKLLASDDKAFIIEMSLVSPPFIVDFGGAYLDEPAPHTQVPHIYAEWETEKQEQFGANWGRTKLILAELAKQYQIYVADVNPGNIQF